MCWWLHTDDDEMGQGRGAFQKDKVGVILQCLWPMSNYQPEITVGGPGER